MQTVSDPVIELVRVDVSRADAPAAVPIVHDVNWAIGSGDFWAVGAYAGTGKTDLLCTAASLERPLSGTHLLFGRDTSRMSEEELVTARMKIAMVFTGGRLFNDLSVAENVALPLQYHGKLDKQAISEKVSATLEITGLKHIANKWPGELTRNLHQRIALARALALDPEILFLDNPLTGVDARLARWWLDFLCQLNKGKLAQRPGAPMTIIVATDDLRPWSDSASSFAIVKERQFHPIGGRQDIKASSDAIVRDLLMPAFES
jgi:phospholipid/cholesterol/gamma-HCH transport system ATP-binding protein